MSRTPREVAEEAHRLISEDKLLDELFAEDGVLAWPFRIPGVPAEVHGRDAIRAHFESLKEYRDNFEIEEVNTKILETEDPEVVLMELVQRGHSGFTDSPYQLTALGIIRVQDGLIVRYDDYTNPIGLVQMLNGLAELAAALVSEPTPEWAMAR
jgi:uncharacterized protein